MATVTPIRELPKLERLNMQPAELSILTTDPAEQEARINGSRIVDQLVERFGAHAVYRWTYYAAAKHGQDVPQEGGR